MAANYSWPIYKLDVKHAFQNGNLEEEVFMDLPPGFEKEFGNGKVCRLVKALYGLNQSPRAWFERFSKVVKKKFSAARAMETIHYFLSTLRKERELS